MSNIVILKKIRSVEPDNNANYRIRPNYRTCPHYRPSLTFYFIFTYHRPLDDLFPDF